MTQCYKILLIFFSYLDRDNSAQSNILLINVSAILIIMFIDDLLLITIQT